VDLDVLATVIALASPELRVRLAREQIAAADERLSQTELIVAGGGVEGRVARGIRGVGLEHDFRVEPGLVVGMFRVEPVVDEDELAVLLGFIPEAILGPRAWSLECDLLSSPAVRAVTGTEVAVEFERGGLLL